MVILGGVHFPSHFRSHLPAHFFHISHFLASWTSHFWHIFGTFELILDLESYIGHGRHNARYLPNGRIRRGLRNVSATGGRIQTPSRKQIRGNPHANVIYEVLHGCGSGPASV